MCGIVGYIGKNNDVKRGLGMLKRLEYRGYDCLSPDTLIQLSDGRMKTIEELELNSLVSSINFKNLSFADSKVESKAKKIKNKLYRIRTNNFEIKCSPEHNFFVYENGKIIEKRAFELKKGDFLLAQKEIPIKGKIQKLPQIENPINYQLLTEGIEKIQRIRKKLSFSYLFLKRKTGVSYVADHLKGKRATTKENWQKILSLMDIGADKFLKKFAKEKICSHAFKNLFKGNYLTPELSQVIGYIIGDESRINSGMDTKIKIEDDRETLKEYQRIFKKLGLKVKLLKHRHKNCWQIRIYSASFGKLLNKIAPGILDDSLKREVPEIIQKSPLDCVAGFLRGFFDAEGSVGERKKEGISLQIGNEKLIKQIQLLLLRFGILSNLSFSKVQKQTRLSIYLFDSLKKFLSSIGFSSPRKMERLKKLIKLRKNLKHKSLPVLNQFIFLTQIKTIEITSSTHLMYDISVPKTQNFIANGLLVHNSAGLAVFVPEKKKIFCLKKVGKITNLEEEFLKSPVYGNPFIMQTRWATHGGVTEENAHPHFDCKKEIFLVHNGIIENYKELKEKLTKEGHKFTSETDSVAPETGLILLSPEGLLVVKEIDSLVDEEIERKKELVIERITNDGRKVEYVPLEEWKVLTCNQEGRLSFEKIKWGIRKERGKKALVSIRSATGRITITKDHSIFQYEKGSLNPNFPEALKNVVSIRRIPSIEKVKEINLLKLGENEEVNNSLKVFGYLPIPLLKNLLKEIPELKKYAYIDNHQPLEKRGRISLPLSEAARIGVPQKYLKYFWIGSRRGKTKLPILLKMTSLFGKIIGFFLSEGSCRLKKSNYLSKREKYLAADIVFCTNHNKKIISEVVDAVFKTFHFKPSVVISKEKSGKITIKVCASRLVLYHLFQNVLKCGKGSDKKNIPLEIINAPKKVKKAFLRAYFLGDGSKRHRQISTTSKNILNGLRLLYWQLGIPISSGIGRTTTLGGKTEYTIKFHRIKLRKRKYPLKEIYKKYFSSGKFTQRIHNDISYGNFELSKTDRQAKYVYDLEVNPTHSFVTSEGIVCHNTEVMCHLIEKYFKGNLEEAVRLALKEVIGAYAIAVICENDPEKIVFARYGSPLLIALGEGENFLASDAPAILAFTRKVIYLDDGEMGYITKDDVKIFDLNQVKKEKTSHLIEWTLEEAQKGGYEHFMLKEIMEEPEAIENALRGRVIESEGRAKLGGLERIEDKIKEIERLKIIGMGTALLAGKVGEYMIEEYAEIPVEVENASEFRYKKFLPQKGEAILAISQSGETADTLFAIKEAKKKGILTLGIVNVVGSSIAREVEAGIYNHAGPEISVAATKSFVSQLTVLALLTVFFGRQRNMSLVMGKRILEELKKLPNLARQILNQKEKIATLAKKYKNYKNFLFLGRKYNYPIALEGALKLKEISYLHAEGYPAGEMKHGPIALIDENFPTVAICPSDSVYEKMISNLEEIKARKGKIFAIATEGNKEIEKLADDVFFIPKTLEMLTPILSVFPLHLFAYFIAKELNRPIDTPRNLAKSVTVE